MSVLSGTGWTGNRKVSGWNVSKRCWTRPRKCWWPRNILWLVAVCFYDYAGLLLLGLGRLRAQQLETEFGPVAVWDGLPGDAGEAAEVVSAWQARGFDVETICLNDVLGEPAPTRGAECLPLSPPPDAFEDHGTSFETRLKAMLFADAVGFSKLNETQVAHFVRHFLGSVSDLVTEGGYGPMSKATWGDGLYFVFGSAGEAGRFALDVVSLVARRNWAEYGLPADLNLRIALHAGPVYKFIDPLTQRQSYTGTHVTRAARIEPVTPPGQVYASREFAALAAAEGAVGFTCDYVGLIPLAKKYGVIPMFHLRPSGGAPS